jgi:hypothetical protein
MYDRQSCTVFYGEQTKQFTAIPGGALPVTINYIEELCLDDIQAELQQTVFDMDFDLRIKHTPEMTVTAPKGKVVLPESIIITGTGVQVVYHRVPVPAECAMGEFTRSIERIARSIERKYGYK